MKLTQTTVNVKSFSTANFINWTWTLINAACYHGNVLKIFLDIFKRSNYFIFNIVPKSDFCNKDVSLLLSAIFPYGYVSLWLFGVKCNTKILLKMLIIKTRIIKNAKYKEAASFTNIQIID